MTNTQTHAQKELDILEKSIPDALITPFRKEILALCEAFGKSGQSGGSAPYTARALSQTIEKLCLQETISPLTGENNEWDDITSINNGEVMYQNNRESAVFKDNTGAYYVDAIIFDGDIGGYFTGNSSVELADGTKLGSAQYIKTFPFTPKKFFIDVFDWRWKDKEEKIPDPDGDWWTHGVKDEAQLKEVFEYYNRK